MLEEFSTDKLYYVDQEMEDYIEANEGRDHLACVNPMHLMNEVVGTLNYYRNLWISCDKALKANEFYGSNPEEQRKRIKAAQKKYWWQMIQLLPSSYNQTRNVMMNYEVLANIYKSRKNHKLDEWRELCKWIEELPYSELIIDSSSLKSVKVGETITAEFKPKILFGEPFPWIKEDKED